jgi:hypothetical protein
LLRNTPGSGFSAASADWQFLGQQEIPGEQLQQQGDVAEDFDVGSAQSAQQDIPRQAAGAEAQAQDGRQDDGRQRHPQGVEYADEKGTPIRLRGVEVEHALADREAGRLEEKGKTAAYAARPQFGAGLLDQQPDEGQRQPGDQ